MACLRTDNSLTGVPFGGPGLFWTQDDIAKIALLFSEHNGVIQGIQVLNPEMLADAMQKDPHERGLDTTGTAVFKYNNVLWAKKGIRLSLGNIPAHFGRHLCPATAASRGDDAQWLDLLLFQ